MSKSNKTPASSDSSFSSVRPRIRYAAGFLALLVSFLLNNADVFAQYSGPEFGSIPGGETVSTGEFMNLSDATDSDQEKVRNRHWERFDPPLVDDIYNNTPAAAPAGSNVFIDPAAVDGAALISDAPGVMIDFEGIADRGRTIPPDPIMAVGPNHVMALVNSEFAIYDKQGNELFRSNADPWFQNVLPSADAFDPVVIYDHFDDRWVMLWDHWNDATDDAFWLISVSDDSNPMGTWCNYAFQANLNGMTDSFAWGDYPKMGYDERAVYVSGRMFAFSGGFRYCKIRIIPKEQLYDLGCGPVDYTDFYDFRDPENISVRVDGPPIAASHLDSSGNTAYIVVDAPYNTSTFITLWTIEDPLGASPTVTGVNIPTTAASEPPDANQLGGGTPRIDSGRRAYRNAVYKGGQLWTATAIRGGAGNQYAFARYLRLDVNTPAVIEDVAFGADGFFYLYPAIMVDAVNNMVMVFSRSADDEYCGAAYTGRRRGEDGLSPSILLKEGEANYVKTFSGTRNRWGDYMGIAQDPDDTNIIWCLVEYAASPEDTWGSWIGAFGYQYMVSGVIREVGGGEPVEFATLVVEETGRTITTDSTGAYSLASPVADVTLSISAFAYQSQSIPVTITLNTPDVLDIEMEPEIVATFSGQVFDTLAQAGVAAELELFVEGDPNPGPYSTASTDSSGNFSIQSIIGIYDIIVDAESPYLTDAPYDSLVLEEGGIDIELAISPAEVMLVDDDDGSEYESYYIEALRNIDISYHLWSNDVAGEPTIQDLSAYPGKIVTWFTGDGATTTLTAAELLTLTGHLNNGGSLFLTGQNVAEQADGNDLMDKLGVAFRRDNETTLVRGKAGSFAEGMAFTTSGAGGADNQTSRDQLEITDAITTSSLFTYGVGDTAVAAVVYEEGSASAVLLGFGWEAIHNSINREAVMIAIMEYFDPGIVGIEGSESTPKIPAGYALFQNYPNPFNPSTTIRFSIPERSGVEIDIYDMRGRKVRALISRECQAGTHEVHWDGKDDLGRGVATGIYFYKMSGAGRRAMIKKLVVLK